MKLHKAIEIVRSMIDDTSTSLWDSEIEAIERMLEEISSYPYTLEPQKLCTISSNTETEDILVDIMDVDGNYFRDIIKVSMEPTIIKLD